MGIFDDDEFDDIFGKKKTYSGFDKIGVSKDTKDAMTAVNKYQSGRLSHGLDFGQSLQADKAKDSLDATFIGKPKKKKGFW